MKLTLSPALALLLCIALIATSCRKPKDLVYKDFKNLNVDKLSFSNATLKVDLIYFNPNNFGVELARTDLEVYLDSTFVGKSTQEFQIKVPKKADFTIPLVVNLDVKNLLKNGITALQSLMNKDVNVRFKGLIKVGKLGVYKSFPVDYTMKQNFSNFLK
jgi:LEA14-like dessication related protein